MNKTRKEDHTRSYDSFSGGGAPRTLGLRSGSILALLMPGGGLECEEKRLPGSWPPGGEPPRIPPFLLPIGTLLVPDSFGKFTRENSGSRPLGSRRPLNGCQFK